MGTITKRGQKYLARTQYTRNYITETKSRSFNSRLDALMWMEKLKNLCDWVKAKRLIQLKHLKML